MFRDFLDGDELRLAAEIIGSIDQGERWIFLGAEGATEFEGFIDRLFFRDGETYGTYCASVFRGKVRIQLGFNTDLPEHARPELLSLFSKARSRVDGPASVWYPPANTALDEFIFSGLPWKIRGHKTHELSFPDVVALKIADLPQGFSIVPFEAKFLDDSCALLDEALAHTFNDPRSAPFTRDKLEYADIWSEKARTGDCCLLLEGGQAAGMYILNGTEIDIMAVAVRLQNRRLGSALLHAARKHIVSTRNAQPHLYCIERNRDALRFYLREGMAVTGHSGYGYME